MSTFRFGGIATKVFDMAFVEIEAKTPEDAKRHIKDGDWDYLEEGSSGNTEFEWDQEDPEEVDD